MQVARPPSMKKEGIQTRKRKPKGPMKSQPMSMQGDGQHSQFSGPPNVKPPALSMSSNNSTSVAASIHNSFDYFLFQHITILIRINSFDYFLYHHFLYSYFDRLQSARVDQIILITLLKTLGKITVKT